MVILALLVTGCTQAAGAAPVVAPAASAASVATAAKRATFDLTVTGGPAAGTYAADPATSLNSCRRSSTGVWTLLYAGGDPFVNLDLVVAATAGQPGGSDAVALELSAGPGYLRFDPTAMRGGDPKGRSSAHGEIEPGAGSTTMTVDATTPDRTSGADGAPVRVQLTVTCPN
jgi:hypothetical protein